MCILLTSNSPDFDLSICLVIRLFALSKNIHIHIILLTYHSVTFAILKLRQPGLDDIFKGAWCHVRFSILKNN